MTQTKYSYIRRDASRGRKNIDTGSADKGPPPPPPLRPCDLVLHDLVKVYDAEVFRGEWRLCEVEDISTDVVACRDLKIGVMTSFRILDYRANDGVRKVVHSESD